MFENARQGPYHVDRSRMGFSHLIRDPDGLLVAEVDNIKDDGHLPTAELLAKSWEMNRNQDRALDQIRRYFGQPDGNADPEEVLREVEEILEDITED